MIAFPAMLVASAKAAGIKVPENPDDYNVEEYPHFTIFCNMQLGSPMPSWSVHWGNATVIAEIPDDKVRTITAKEILDMGFAVGYH